MSKNSQHLQALRDNGNRMYAEGQADGKAGVPMRYHRTATQFNRYQIGYKHAVAANTSVKLGWFTRLLTKLRFW